MGRNAVMHRITRALGAVVVTALVTTGLTAAMSSPTNAQPTTSERRGLLGDTLAVVTAPLLSGAGAVGSPLSLTMPTWNLPGVTTTTTWLSNGVPIPGASGTSYVPTAADAGAGIQALVTGTVLGLVAVPAYSNIIAIPAGGGSGDPGGPGAPGTDLLTLLSGLGLPASAEVGQLIVLTDPVWSLPGVTTTYQWLRDGVPIPGADDPFFVPGLEDAGHAVSAQVTGTLLGVPGVSVVTSALNIPLVDATPVSPVGDVTITGSKKIGTALTLMGPTWDPASASTKYQWLRDDTPIAGATDKAYQLKPIDLGHAMSVKATGHQDGYVDNTVTSDAVTPLVGDAIQFTTKPRITGTGQVGKLLTADPGAWSGAGEDGALPTYGYQWRRDGVAIAGAVAQTYQVQSADIGRSITATVTATRPAYKPGTFSTGPIAVAKLATSLKATLAKSVVAKGKKALLKLVLRATGTPSPTGLVSIMDGKKAIKKITFTKSQKGRQGVTLALKPGVHRLRAVYAGSATLAGTSSKVVKLTVKR